MTPQYSAKLGLIVTLLLHYLIANAFEGSGNGFSGLYFHSEIIRIVVP